MESKEMLVSLLGEKDGESLYTAAIIFSARTGVALEDVVQEFAISSQKIIAEQGKYIESYTINDAKHALYSSRYGVNLYYWKQGISEEYREDRRSHGGYEGCNEFGDLDDEFENDNPTIETDLSATFEEAYSTLTKEQKHVLNALAGGWQSQEIAQALGKSNAWVSQQKAALKAVFGYAVETH